MKIIKLTEERQIRTRNPETQETNTHTVFKEIYFNADKIENFTQSDGITYLWMRSAVHEVVETPPAKQAIEIIPQRFDFELKYLEERLPDVLMAKYGQKVPKRCEKCEYCRRTRQLSGFVEVADLID